MVDVDGAVVGADPERGRRLRRLADDERLGHEEAAHHATQTVVVGGPRLDLALDGPHFGGRAAGGGAGAGRVRLGRRADRGRRRRRRFRSRHRPLAASLAQPPERLAQRLFERLAPRHGLVADARYVVRVQRALGHYPLQMNLQKKHTNGTFLRQQRDVHSLVLLSYLVRVKACPFFFIFGQSSSASAKSFCFTNEG